MWSHDDKELFYNPRAGAFEAVSVTKHPTFAFGNAVAVPKPFNLGPPSARRLYDVTPDGKILGIAPAGVTLATSAQIHVVLNWFEELRARVR